MKIYKNEYKIHQNYAILKITKENIIIAEILIDIEDVDKINKYSWRLNEKGYVVTDIKGKKVRLHNLILNRDTSDPKIVCDHINRNKLDNRKENLRIVTQKENNLNRNVTAKHIYYHKTNNRWDVIINRKSIGSRKTKELAEKLYRQYCENQCHACGAYVLSKD